MSEIPQGTKTSVREVLESLGEQSDSAAPPPPPRPSRIRGDLEQTDTSRLNKGQLISLGSEAVIAMERVLHAEEKIVVVDDMDALAAALAEDEGTSIDAAKKKLVDNQARAFTAETTGVIYFLECPEKPHDMIHETVHVTSAPGGTTRIKARFGDPLNEGITEMYTKEFCLKQKVRIAPAYPSEVAFVTKLQRVVGPAMLFDAYMKNAGMGAILTTLSARWLERAESLAAQGFGPPEEEDQRVAVLAERLADGNFLKGAAEFWNALL